MNTGKKNPTSQGSALSDHHMNTAGEEGRVEGDGGLQALSCIGVITIISIKVGILIAVAATTPDLV